MSEIPQMKVTVELPDEVVEVAMQMTGEKAKGPALARAVKEYIKREQAREFGRLIREGAFDYPLVVSEDAGTDPGNPVPPLEDRAED